MFGPTRIGCKGTMVRLAVRLRRARAPRGAEALSRVRGARARRRRAAKRAHRGNVRPVQVARVAAVAAVPLDSSCGKTYKLDRGAEARATRDGGPMRVCLFASTALPRLGGQELVVDHLARQFQAVGHEPVVL